MSPAARHAPGVGPGGRGEGGGVSLFGRALGVRIPETVREEAEPPGPALPGGAPFQEHRPLGGAGHLPPVTTLHAQGQRPRPQPGRNRTERPGGRNDAYPTPRTDRRTASPTHDHRASPNHTRPPSPNAPNGRPAIRTASTRPATTDHPRCSRSRPRPAQRSPTARDRRRSERSAASSRRPIPRSRRWCRTPPAGGLGRTPKDHDAAPRTSAPRSPPDPRPGWPCRRRRSAVPKPRSAKSDHHRPAIARSPLPEDPAGAAPQSLPHRPDRPCPPTGGQTPNHPCLATSSCLPAAAWCWSPTVAPPPPPRSPS